MTFLKTSLPSLKWFQTLLFILIAAGCFHAAYSLSDFHWLKLSIIGYAICLVQLCRQKTVRHAFYGGLATGFACFAPQLGFFWNIFGGGAIALWLVLAFWTGTFAGISCATLKRFGPVKAAILIPFLWTGLEYFRSELYYLKFSWLNIGFAPSALQIFFPLGVYGLGFLACAVAALFLVFRARFVFLILVFLVCVRLFSLPTYTRRVTTPNFFAAGIQMEFPNEREIPPALDKLVAKYPNANVLVLSEYTLDGPVPDSLKEWCKHNQKYLVVGGKDPVPGNFYDTAFVVSPQGEIVFKQAKSVPIQFFKDGLPAKEQALWNSPWGKIGICICYDLSYSRVTDRLIKMGAQMLIVPTMDIVDWGKHQHELHSLVAPVRAAEYGVPIFRVGSSGISQAVAGTGRVIAKAAFPGEGEMLHAGFRLPEKGSLPLDRFLAPFSVGVTALLLLFLIFAPRLKPKGSSEK